MSRAFEAKPSNPAVHALVRLHADLGAQIRANKERGAKLAGDMKAVEAVIRMFDPAYDMRAISVRRRVTGNPWIKRGDCFRQALGVLREAEKPLTTREVALRLLAKHGVTEPTIKNMRDMYGAIHRGLRNHTGKSVRTAGEGMPVRWVIAD